MAKGLTEKQRRNMFQMIDLLSLRVSDKEPVPLEESKRVRFLTERIEMHDKTEPYCSILCAQLIFTLYGSSNNYSSILERTLAEHVISAYKSGNIDLGDIPSDSFAVSSFQTTIVNSYIENPDKTAADIEAALADCLRFADDELFELRTYHELQTAYAVARGDFSAARESIAAFLATERTEDSDCEGCEYDRLIKAYLVMGDLEKAQQYISKILEGKLKCESDIPEKTKVQAAYIATQRGDKNAKKLLKAAVKNLYASKYLYFEAALSITSACDLDELDAAEKIVRLFRPVMVEHPYEVGTFQFYIAAYLAKKQLGDIDDAAFWKGRAEEYAKEFDLRNGNAFYRAQIK
jgi:hypothetical protein